MDTAPRQTALPTVVLRNFVEFAQNIVFNPFYGSLIPFLGSNRVYTRPLQLESIPEKSR